MKETVLIYTDCYIYGGSERLMGSLFRNEIVNQEYSFRYVYRNHKLYKNGLKKEYSANELIAFKGINVISFDTLFYQINRFRLPKIVRNGMKIPFWIISKLGICDLYNFFVQYCFVRRLNPDIVHINNGGYPAARTCRTMVFAAWLAGCRSIVFQVNNQALKPKTKLEGFIDKMINKRVAYFITASKLAKKNLAQNRKFPEHKIILVPNTVPEETVTKGREEICTAMNISIEQFLMTEVAFLEKRKGQVLLIRAMEILKESSFDIYNKLCLLIVGSGIDREKLEAIVNKKEMQNHIKFVGYCPDSINYIAASDLFILPSIENEDMPLVILTAMKLGKTIISTDFAGIREEIEDGVSGILLSPNEITLPNDLANAIIQVYNGVSLGKEAKLRFQSMFSSEIYGLKIKDIYKSLK
ncbi:glycosyltransferase [Coprobacter fastidiosus]|uniref:glycosyltransferase n=1 Tax=Coprobacter fastidiosus TaxID=1099853 RepID=UPI00320A1373